MTCNYNKKLPHIQILSHPNSKIGNFSSSNPITTDYAKSKILSKKIIRRSKINLTKKAQHQVMPRLWFQQGELERIEDFDDASLVFKA